MLKIGNKKKYKRIIILVICFLFLFNIAYGQANTGRKSVGEEERLSYAIDNITIGHSVIIKVTLAIIQPLIDTITRNKGITVKVLIEPPTYDFKKDIIDKKIDCATLSIPFFVKLGVGGRLTAIVLRKVPSRSGLGNCESSKGENPCRDTETTQLKNNCYDSLGDEVFLGFDETVNLHLEQVQKLRSVVQTAQR